MNVRILGIILGALTFSSSALAVDNWECRLDGNVSGVKLGFIFGGQFLQGYGQIDCIEINNPTNHVVEPVKLTVAGGGIGFDFTIVRSVRLISAGIGNVVGPESFLGSFKVGATAGATLINQGINADAAVKITKNNGFGLELGLIGEDALGLGARLHGLVFIVEPAR
jgi:hypothetical protein